MAMKKKNVKTILVATNRLSKLSGTETYTYAIIEELSKRKKYDIEYFTFNKGLVSDRIENDLGVKFFSKSKYDLILANHNTCVNFLYKKGFIIQTCHGIYPELEQPSLKADAFVSISQEVQAHLALKNLPSLIILNGINLDRYKIKHKVSKKIVSLLSLCHSRKANDLIKQVCEEENIKYVEAFKYDNPVWDVENKINEVDLVIGLGRSAYESMACGRPAIIYDNRGYFESFGDGYIKNNLGLSLQNNCSGRYFKRTFDKSTLKKELEKYNPEDSLFFRNFAIRELDIKKQLDKYFEYFDALNTSSSKTFLYKKVLEYFKFKKWTFTF